MKMAVMALAMMALALAGCVTEAADPQESTQTQLSTDCLTVISQWEASGNCHYSESGSSCSVATCCGGDNDGTSVFVLCTALDGLIASCGSKYYTSDSYGSCGEPLPD